MSVVTILRHAAEQGELPPDVDAEMLFDIYAGAVFYRTMISGVPVTDTHVDQLVGLLLDGRAPRNGQDHAGRHGNG